MRNHHKLTKSHLQRKITLLVMLCAAIIFLNACASFRINSDWRTDDVVINGNMEEWRGGLYYIEGDDFSLGLRNDDKYMYICIAAESRIMGTIALTRGMTVWFDPGGKKSRVFGIKYPQGRTMDPERRQAMTDEERRDFIQRMAEGRQDVFDRMLENASKDVVILGPEKGAETKIPIEDLKNIELKLEIYSGLLVYELKVPLAPQEDFPFAVGALPGQSIGIGIEIPKMDMSAMRGRMPGGGMGGRGGGMPGGGMGGRGMGGGMRGGAMSGGFSMMISGLKFWVTVALAETAR